MRLTLALCLIAAPAMAQETCASRDVFLEGLKTKYGETIQFQGLNARGQLVEVTGNPKSGDWTALVTTPEGLTCMTATGKTWGGPAPKGEAL